MSAETLNLNIIVGYDYLFQMWYTIIASFFVSLFAIIIAQWVWKLFMGPRVVVTVEGLSEAHPVNKIRYFKIGVKNSGYTAAKSVTIYIRPDKTKDKDFIPKWDSIPEATVAGNAFLFDFYQRIDIPPAGMHKELIPIIIIPTQNIQSKNYTPNQAYIFSNFHHYSGKDVDETKISEGESKGSLHISCENYYAKYSMEISYKKKEQDVSVRFKPELISRFIYRAGKIQDK